MTTVALKLGMPYFQPEHHPVHPPSLTSKTKVMGKATGDSPDQVYMVAKIPSLRPSHVRQGILQDGDSPSLPSSCEPPDDPAETAVTKEVIHISDEELLVLDTWKSLEELREEEKVFLCDLLLFA